MYRERERKRCLRPRPRDVAVEHPAVPPGVHLMPGDVFIIYIYIYTHTYIHTHMYIYIYV